MTAKEARKATDTRNTDRAAEFIREVAGAIAHAAGRGEHSVVRGVGETSDVLIDAAAHFAGLGYATQEVTVDQTGPRDWFGKAKAIRVSW